MINHLKGDYHKITPADLKLNTAPINAPHNINKSFESIIEKIETAVDFTDARKVPYTPEQVMTTAYNLIFATGYFTDACCQWNQRRATSNTWVNFKTYFADEHRAWQDTHPTPVGAAYLSSNALVKTNNREAETINDITLLTLATANDRETYVNLSGTVMLLMATPES